MLGCSNWRMRIFGESALTPAQRNSTSMGRSPLHLNCPMETFETFEAHSFPLGSTHSFRRMFAVQLPCRTRTTISWGKEARPLLFRLWHSPKVYPQLESEANVTDDELTSILESVGSGPEAGSVWWS